MANRSAVGDIWQIGTIGREYADRPGSSVGKAAEACASLLAQMGLAHTQIGRLGDRTASEFWAYLDAMLPKAKFVPDNAIIDRMQRVRSPAEIELSRAAAQLISIGTQAAYHVTRPGVTDAEIYAAFTMAQLARGGETGDGYQIGINQYGTHWRQALMAMSSAPATSSTSTSPTSPIAATPPRRRA